MKKIVLGLLILIGVFSCKSDAERKTEENKKELLILKYTELSRKRNDSILKNMKKNSYTDTTGIGNSPIKVYKYKIVEKEYSTSYKDIKLYYKNVSKKNISAIRFEWYGENAFNEPADMGSSINLGAGGGFTDDALKVGSSANGIWDISSKDVKKIISARDYEVMFEDGSKWTLKKD